MRYRSKAGGRCSSPGKSHSTRTITSSAQGILRAQTEQVFKNLEVALAAAGATFADVVKWTTYVVDFKPADRAVIAEVRARFLAGNPPPASTLIGVQSLVLPELKIEVEAIAVVD